MATTNARCWHQMPVPLEELEIHLREDVERQMRSGLNEQQAFEITVGELAKPP